MSLIDKDSPFGEESSGGTTEEDSLVTIKEYRKERVMCQEKGPHNMWRRLYPFLALPPNFVNQGIIGTVLGDGLLQALYVPFNSL